MKTIIAIDHINKPSLLLKLACFLFGWKLVYSETKKCFELKRKVKGEVYNKVFYPFFGQCVTYRIYLNKGPNNES